MQSSHDLGSQDIDKENNAVGRKNIAMNDGVDDGVLCVFFL